MEMLRWSSLLVRVLAERVSVCRRLPERVSQSACVDTGLPAPSRGCLTLRRCLVQLCMCVAPLTVSNLLHSACER